MEGNEKFEMHMVVELFGHQKIAGKVSEAEIGEAGFIRVDASKTSKREGFTKFYGPLIVTCRIRKAYIAWILLKNDWIVLVFYGRLLQLRPMAAHTG